ncbi:MAG: hypothetical protein KDK07_19770 [Bauldia sp.]|nr:hypothetical protein [Bauldia sp.]
MSVGSVGIFSFQVSPIDSLPPLRLRAMMAEAALQEVDLRFFSTKDCDLGNTRVMSRRWARGRWTEEPADLPSLILYINRPRSPEEEGVDRWIRARARVVDFRDRDKLEVDRLVQSSPFSQYAIPGERLDPDRAEAQLSGWLAGGGIVVKASDGMRGIGIQFAIRDGETWSVIRDDVRWQGSATGAVARVLKTIRGRMSYRPYLVQRLIESRDELGQPVAIRVDIVRTPGGGWDLARMAGRIAAQGKLVSNGARGGAYMPIASFLATRKVRPAGDIEAEALALARGVADILITRPGSEDIYECGVDLAIDPQDRLWFIEANPRPQALGAQHERAILVIAYLKALASA